MSQAAISKLWLETPLIKSGHISDRLGCSAYLKLENLQPSQSFKSRGISLFAQRCREKYGPLVHLVIASGGNAGIALACAANTLKLRCSVFIPEGPSPETLAFLKKEGADVVIKGRFYAEALEQARIAVQRDEHGVMVPAYDDPIIWEGHASIIQEMAQQIPHKPDAIFCSVGGAGLLGGILSGCKQVNWDDVPVVTLETHGSNCFYHSISVNEGRFIPARGLPTHIETLYNQEHNVSLAHLKKLDSRASSLGASIPAAGVVKIALERKGGIQCVCIPDELAMQTAVAFAEDHKMMLELACSATLTPAYKSSLFEELLPGKKDATVVFIVCGGFKITLDEMEEYRQITKREIADATTCSWEVQCDGNLILVPKA